MSQIEDNTKYNMGSVTMNIPKIDDSDPTDPDEGTPDESKKVSEKALDSIQVKIGGPLGSLFTKALYRIMGPEGQQTEPQIEAALESQQQLVTMAAAQAIAQQEETRKAETQAEAPDYIYIHATSNTALLEPGMVVKAINDLIANYNAECKDNNYLVVSMENNYQVSEAQGQLEKFAKEKGFKIFYNPEKMAHAIAAMR